MSSRLYLSIPFLVTKSWKGSEEKIGQAKNRISKDHMTIIIATNFIWEQLIIASLREKSKHRACIKFLLPLLNVKRAKKLISSYRFQICFCSLFGSWLSLKWFFVVTQIGQKRTNLKIPLCYLKKKIHGWGSGAYLTPRWRRIMHR